MHGTGCQRKERKRKVINSPMEIRKKNFITLGAHEKNKGNQHGVESWAFPFVALKSTAKKRKQDFHFIIQMSPSQIAIRNTNSESSDLPRTLISPE